MKTSLCRVVVGLLGLAALWAPRSFGQFWRVDPTFTAPVIEEALYGGAGSLTPLSDGGVLLSRHSGFINGAAYPAVVRLGRDGAVLASYEPPSGSTDFRVLAAYSDGRVLMRVLRNGAWSLVRLSVDGTVDNSFSAHPLGPGGGAEAHLLADGKILVWSFEDGLSQAQKLLRLTANGAVDTSFAAPHAIIDQIADAESQPDGAVVAAGRFLPQGASSPAVSVVRFTSSGALDTTFTAGTEGASAWWDSRDRAETWIQVQQGGSILVGNLTTTKLIRLLPSGAKDATFAPGLPSGNVDSVRKPALGGKVYFGHYTADNQYHLKRLNADGTLDAGFSFSGDGGQGWSVHTPVTWDGSVLYFGPFTPARYIARLGLTQMDSSGAINPAFNLRFGQSTTPELFDRGADGRYLFTAFTDFVTNTQVPRDALYRLTSEGKLDTSHTIPSISSDDRVHAIRGLADGSYLYVLRDELLRADASGAVTARTRIGATATAAFSPEGFLYFQEYGADGSWRHYRPDTTIDTSFTPAAGVLMERLIPAYDGFSYGLKSQGGLVRLNRDGSVQTSFTEVPRPAGSASYAVLPDNTVLIVALGGSVGDGQRAATFTRYDSAGSPTYTYEGSTDSLIVAGVLFDLLRAAAPAGGSVSLFIGNRDLHVHVRTDGQATVSRPGMYPVIRYARTSLTSPSVPGGGPLQPPAITEQPVSLTVTEGSEARFRVASSTHVSDYRWELRRAGSAAWEVPVQSNDYAGLLSEQVIIKKVTLGMNGDAFRCRLYNAAGEATSATAVLTVVAGGNEPAPTDPTPEPGSPLVNISTRAYVSVDDKVEIAGFVIRGTGPKTVLIRAIGPSLPEVEAPLLLADPMLTLYAGTTPLSQNDDWAGGAEASTAQLEEATARGGAFPLARASKDAVILATLQPGSYTAHVSGKDRSTGIAMVEVYDVGGDKSSLVNISTRSDVRDGHRVQIGGFVVRGASPRKVLIRATGPALVDQALPAASLLPDPRFTLYSGTVPIQDNNDWSADPAQASIVEEASRKAGAFALVRGSKDAALVTTLAPGAYTAVVSCPGATGVALIEVYLLAD